MKRAETDITRELEIIRKTIGRFKEGASLEDIRSASGLEIAPRTLQRRLDKLKEQRSVAAYGKTRTTLYYPVFLAFDYQAQDDSFVVREPARAADEDGLIPLSEEGYSIRKAVMQPIAMRPPVEYNRDFLLSYRPNVDSYLSPDEKRWLATLGRTARLEHPAGTYAREVLERLLIDLSWNSSRLEGNTYSLLDTQQLISRGKAADDKTTEETQMILNHKYGIEFIVQAADEIDFNHYTITNLHALLSYNLLRNRNSEGRLRLINVGIGNSPFIPLIIPQQIEEMFEIMLEKANAIQDPFEQAFFIMVQLPYLQPFEDVNKRVSRLAANIPLSKHNFAPLAFIGVPQELYVQGMLGIYELNRIELLKDLFMWAYERSAQRYAAIRQTVGEPDKFRLKYHLEIRSIVSEALSAAMPPEEAKKLIRSKALLLPDKDQERFTENVDSELLSLHDGNFARYRVRPSEFERWKEVWGR